MDKALTIIIPSYNVSRYIDQLMNSLIEKQEIVDCLDIIIINDESNPILSINLLKILTHIE